ncbi:MAG TPA: hypothetical protein VFN95_07895, partial [Flavitalea sp.]|nr:hypothetical protein [Flavitalea sp.]
SQEMGLNVRIGCSKGNLTVHGDGYFIEINRPREMPSYFHSLEKIQIESVISGTQHLMQDLRDAVLYDQPVQHIVPEEILCGQQLLFGILQSSFQNGEQVSLADLNDNLVITGRTGKLFA